MEDLFVFSVIAAVVGLRVWASSALSDHIKTLPHEQQKVWRRAITQAD